MKRRELLAGSAAFLALPTFLRRAFADQPADNCDPRAQRRALVRLSSAWRRARQGQRPLLVIVIPETGREMAGRHWGALLQHGGPEVMAALGLCEVICARLEDLHVLVPSARGQALAFLVETDRVPARALAILSPPLVLDGDDEEELARPVHALGDKVVQAVAGDPQRRARLAAEAAALSEAAVARLRVQPPTGSLWTHDWGCGADVELPEELRKKLTEREMLRLNMGVLCGMGHAPELTRRFLTFFTLGET
jgi:hypothetical protein